MRKTIILFISTLLFCSCSYRKDNANRVYCIIQHQKGEAVIDKDGMPPLQMSFYGKYNFILVDTSKIYCHLTNKNYDCGTGLDFTKPVRLFLTPENLSEINIDNLDAFLKSIPELIISDKHFYISISSPNDTIKNRAFEIIGAFLKSKNITHNSIRNLTEEEQYVLAAKLENRNYNPDTVDWKIGFAEIPQFVPPIIKDEEPSN